MSKYVDGINEENFDAFLNALRGGEYAQGVHTLENSKGEFCCLGVACKLASQAGVVERAVTEYMAVSYGMSTGALPPSVADWIGLPGSHRIDGESAYDVPFYKQGYDVYGTESAENRANTAIGWNDTLGKTFVEIADAFEAEFLKED